ncbi:MAG: type II toxin-antitoxin system RelE/ParE family toxin [Candidatus Aenigmarchaeota archaeon]|nr:type II toxin-antitoxin system RelE/ParE family toxin [Candidatus Aenigmarchaeota archaeon]
MMFEVIYDPQAEHQPKKLDRSIAQRIIQKTRLVAASGRGIEALKEAAFGYKIRVGDYRVLVDLTYNPSTLWVRYVGHRSTIYKKR